MWNPDSGSPNRQFVRASQRVWADYHRRLKKLKLEWFSASPSEGEYAIDIEHRFEYDSKMREVAMRELREHVIAAVKYGSIFVDGEPEASRGPFLIPV